MNIGGEIRGGPSVKPPSSDATFDALNASDSLPLRSSESPMRIRALNNFCSSGSLRSFSSAMRLASFFNTATACTAPASSACWVFASKRRMSASSTSFFLTIATISDSMAGSVRLSRIRFKRSCAPPILFTMTLLTVSASVSYSFPSMSAPSA